MKIEHHAVLERFFLRRFCPGGTGKGGKTSKKDKMRIRKRKNADSSDDKIRLASK